MDDIKRVLSLLFLMQVTSYCNLILNIPTICFQVSYTQQDLKLSKMKYLKPRQYLLVCMICFCLQSGTILVFSKDVTHSDSDFKS